MRIESHLPAVYVGTSPALSRAVSAVAPAAHGAATQREAAPRADSGAGPRGFSPVWPAAALDARQLGLRVRQALEAYATVRDGEQRDYLRRVMGLEATA